MLTGAWPGGNQELGTPSRTTTWVAGVQVLRLSYSAFLGGSRIRSEAAATAYANGEVSGSGLT